jgi:hypothetical protein
MFAPSLGLSADISIDIFFFFFFFVCGTSAIGQNLKKSISVDVPAGLGSVACFMAGLLQAKRVWFWARSGTGMAGG